MFEKVKNLDFDVHNIVFYKDGIEISIFHPSELSDRFKHYDKSKNFQIWLREKNRFCP